MPDADYTSAGVVVAPAREEQVDVERCGWDELIKRAKQVENELDGQLLTLGRLTSAALRSQRYAGNDDGPLRQAEQLAGQVQTRLELLGRLMEGLERRSEQVTTGSMGGGGVGAAGGASPLHMLQRHRDIYNEYRRDYRKTKEHLTNAREHAELVISVRDEIGASLGTGRSSDPRSLLLAERERIDSARHATDHVIQYLLGRRTLIFPCS